MKTRFARDFCSASRSEKRSGQKLDHSSGEARRPKAAWAAAAFLFIAILALALPAAAQPGRAAAMGGGNSRTVPTASYHAAFSFYYDGDYRTALDRFRDESRRAIKTVNARWIDSICYETMIGECYFQIGSNAEAYEHYTAALNLYLANPTWFSNVVVQQISREANLRKAPPWQVRNLLAPIGHLSTTMLVQMGQLQLAVQGQTPQSGVQQMPQLFPIEPYEIIRCTALSLRRRAELLGPLAARDPLFDSVIAAMQQRAGQPNHWSEAWISVELGAALAAGGRNAQAVAALQRGLLASGELEHQLTGIAHLELGRLAMAAGDYVHAAEHFEEASYDAYYFTDPLKLPDLGLMEEAFRYGALNHILANGKGVFAPLPAAIAWAKVNHCNQLAVSLLNDAAESNLIEGHTQQAMALLDEARAEMGNRTISISRLAARRMYLQATALYQARKQPDGDTTLSKAMSFMHNSSLRLFQIQKADEYYLSGGKGGISAAREAVDLYKEVLRDPQPIDWLTDPMESLSMLCFPHELPYEHWFLAALARKDRDLAFEVSERTRRHRFFTSLSLGGRLESLRWVLEAPKELVPPQAMLQRQDLLTRYPVYKDLHDQAEDLRHVIASLPLEPANADAANKQSQAMNELANIGRKQEIVLREMAVRREPAMLSFPPLRTSNDIQKSLPPGHALLVFFNTTDNLYAFLLNRDKYANWQVAAAPQAIMRRTSSLLRELGNISPSYDLSAKDLADTRWQQDARELLDTLLKGPRDVDFSRKFDELTIVPDGPLWYVPFECLQVKVDGQLAPLISRFRIRYAPTAGLSTAYQEIGHRHGNTAILVGKFSPKLDDEVVDATVKDISKSLPGCVTLKTPLPAPAPVFATAIDRLVVLADLSAASDTQPYEWTPMPNDRTKSAGSLNDWFPLPRRSPDEMILPGYHTACEGSLKRVEGSRRGGRGESLSPGSEIFLSLCGLMSTGTRTILISRWRTDGQSSLDLVREFTQELPHTTPADSWQRAVQVVSESPLSPDAEPRLKLVGSAGDPPRAAHPFFWAGYMLIDAGSPAEKEKK